MQLTEETKRRIQEQASLASAGIRTYGHYQPDNKTRLGLVKIDGVWNGACCAIVYPPGTDEMAEKIYTRFLDLYLTETIGSDYKFYILPGRKYAILNIIQWSDTYPTEDVLAILDKIASGEAFDEVS